MPTNTAKFIHRRSTKPTVLRGVSAKKVAELRPVSFYERAKHLIGSIDGPGDLSTNPKYMEGYGKSRAP